jgi:hypothetical protein
MQRSGRRPLRQTISQVIAFTLLLCFAHIMLKTDMLSEDRLLDYAQLGEQEEAALLSILPAPAPAPRSRSPLTYFLFL